MRFANVWNCLVNKRMQKCRFKVFAKISCIKNYWLYSNCRKAKMIVMHISDDKNVTSSVCVCVCVCACMRVHVCVRTCMCVL